MREPLGGALTAPHSIPSELLLVWLYSRGAEPRALVSASARHALPPQRPPLVVPRPARALLAGDRQTNTSLPSTERGHRAARGALSHWGRARPLTSAWSWRRPVVAVQFHL
jgi:hypothetical protein